MRAIRRDIACIEPVPDEEGTYIVWYTYNYGDLTIPNRSFSMRATDVLDAYIRFQYECAKRWWEVE